MTFRDLLLREFMILSRIEEGELPQDDDFEEMIAGTSAKVIFVCPTNIPDDVESVPGTCAVCACQIRQTKTGLEKLRNTGKPFTTVCVKCGITLAATQAGKDVAITDVPNKTKKPTIH